MNRGSWERRRSRGSIRLRIRFVRVTTWWTCCDRPKYRSLIFAIVDKRNCMRGRPTVFLVELPQQTMQVKTIQPSIRLMRASFLQGLDLIIQLEWTITTLTPPKTLWNWGLVHLTISNYTTRKRTIRSTSPRLYQTSKAIISLWNYHPTNRLYTSIRLRRTPLINMQGMSRHWARLAL